MPAAAVIPAPIAYIKVVAVKKLVVGFLTQRPRPAVERRWRARGTLVIRLENNATLQWGRFCDLDLLL